MLINHYAHTQEFSLCFSLLIFTASTESTAQLKPVKIKGLLYKMELWHWKINTKKYREVFFWKSELGPEQHYNTATDEQNTLGNSVNTLVCTQSWGCPKGDSLEYTALHSTLYPQKSLFSFIFFLFLLPPLFFFFASSQHPNCILSVSSSKLNFSWLSQCAATSTLH